MIEREMAIFHCLPVRLTFDFASLLVMICNNWGFQRSHYVTKSGKHLLMKKIGTTMVSIVMVLSHR